MSNVIQFLSHALIQVGDYLVVECPFSPKKKSKSSLLTILFGLKNTIGSFPILSN